MPNHYHFLVQANKQSIKQKKLGLLISNELSNGFRVAQSQYAQYFNLKYRLSGSVFRPKTKSKNLNESKDYALTCFFYIHQNPVKSGLCVSIVDWEFSSARDFSGLRAGTLIDKSAASKYIDIHWEEFQNELGVFVPEDDLREIFD